MIERLDRLLARPVSMRSLGLVRILVGAIAFVHLRPFIEDALDGRTYQDYFHHSYISFYPELPEKWFTALLVVGGIAAVAMSIGLFSHIATKVTFGVIGYNLFVSTTEMHNNRAYLFIVLGLLALAPCGRALSVDALIRRLRGKAPFEPTSPGWPLWLLRFECASIYAASGTSKLLDPDWFSGTVTWGRLIEKEANVRANLPGGLADLVLDRDFHTFAAKAIIATELFIATGLWWRRTRWLAVFVAVCFHIGIEFTARVQVFSYLGIAVLFIWADPKLPWLKLPRSPFRRPPEARAGSEPAATDAVP
ncbi:MAG: HTTM domain-containing protein [Dehalococcoidia bacterium]